MLPRQATAAQIAAAQIRRALRDGGSAEHAAGGQWFFKEEIKSHGWYTADLRRAARGFRREIRKEFGFEFLVQVADRLFSGTVLEEKIAAVFLLEKHDAEFGDREFQMFETWLDRISSWADHDAAGTLSDRPDGCGQAGACDGSVSLGKGSGSLSPAGGMRGVDPGDAGEKILS